MMKSLITIIALAISLFSHPSFAFDAEKVRADYYKQRKDCRIGDDGTSEQSDKACQSLNVLAVSLKENGYCWDKSEVVWIRCE